MLLGGNTSGHHGVLRIHKRDKHWHRMLLLLLLLLRSCRRLGTLACVSKSATNLNAMNVEARIPSGTPSAVIMSAETHPKLFRHDLSDNERAAWALQTFLQGKDASFGDVRASGLHHDVLRNTVIEHHDACCTVTFRGVRVCGIWAVVER
jgi:hypothetical protein